MLKGETAKDIVMHYTWSRLDDPYGAFCCCEAPSKEALVKLFEKYLPTLLKYTEFVPVLQMYPPTVEYELIANVTRHVFEVSFRLKTSHPLYILARDSGRAQ